VISDTHLGHAKIREYCPNRCDWSDSIEQHDQVIIDAINSKPDGSVILHLGDFGFGSREQLAAYRARIRHQMILVMGNHDRRSLTAYRALGFEHVCRWFDFESQGQLFICRHNPADFAMEDGEKADWLLHGHQHQKPRLTFHLDEYDCGPTAVDCGIDPWSTPRGPLVPRIDFVFGPPKGD
jgi:calcineurin-like phosphoesterase family protein